MWSGEPPDVAGDLGRRTRPVDQVASRDLFAASAVPIRNGCNRRTPNTIRFWVPGSAADGATIAVAPLARTSSPSAYLYIHGYNHVTTVGPAFLLQASVFVRSRCWS